ncbi:MAG: DUF748 domain-containing protein [Cyclobacteriaceae bacterium]|nr:DUF748 domain-containing protein [Cyclobacteriaceae bacterium]
MSQSKPRRPLRKGTKILIIILAVLLVIRLILPSVVLHYANKTLANMKGYYGHINDIDIWLIRGAYKIDSIYLNKLDSNTNKQTPFFASKSIDLSVEWKAIFHGSIVGELVFEEPTLRFTKDKVEPSNLKKDSTSFKDLLHGFMPLKVNRFEVNNGRIKYVDETSKPKVDIEMTNTYILAQNLRNSYDSTVLLPAKVRASADVYDGTLTFNLKLNPLADQPTFDVNAEVKNTNLVKLNEFFQAYAKVDVNKGTFGLYTEVAAKNGKFDGYVKPVIKDLDILGKEDRKDNIFQKMWEAIVGTVADVFTNQPKDQFATKIPFKGDVKDPDANIWYAILTVIRNAFIQALQPSIDNEINIASVDKPKEEKKTFLQKVFGKKDDKKKEEEKEKKK